jgi:hypothetical protein
MLSSENLQVQRGSGADWMSADPTLLAGQLGASLDTNVLKCGDGTKSWSELTPANSTAYNMADVSTGGSGTELDPWTGWDDFLSDLSSNDVVNVAAYFPTGCYEVNQRITTKLGWHIYGDGMHSSLIVTPDDYTDGVFYDPGVVNASINAHLRIHDLAIVNTNRSGTAAGHAIDLGAIHLAWIDRVHIKYFPFGLTLDQAEEVYVRNCYFELLGDDTDPVSRAIWITNGDDHTPTAETGFSNVIHVEKCLFNSSEGLSLYQVFIVDDGGYQHTFVGNEFNGGAKAMTVSGLIAGTISENYFEAQRDILITLNDQTLDDPRSVGPTQAIGIRNNLVQCTTPAAIKLISTAKIEISGNIFAGTPDNAQDAFVVGAAGLGDTITAHTNGVTVGRRLFDNGEVTGTFERGECRIADRRAACLTTQFDKSNDSTLQDIPGLVSEELEPNRAYRFRAHLFVDANATAGHKYAIGGWVTPSLIRYQIDSISNSTGATVISSRQTSLGGSAGQASATTVETVIEGVIEVGSSGTITAQFAQNAATASTTSSVLPGSTLEVIKI